MDYMKVYGIGSRDSNGDRKVTNHLKDIQVISSPYSTFIIYQAQGRVFPTQLNLRDKISEGIEQDLLERVQGTSLGPIVYEAIRKLEIKLNIKDSYLTNSGEDCYLFKIDPNGKLKLF